jgi:hypothetical protein
VRGWLVAAVTAGAGLLAANADPPADARQVGLLAQPPTSIPRPKESLRFDLPSRRALAPMGRDLFGTPPPPPAPPVEHKVDPPPPPPSAPPLPFTFLGTFESEGGDMVFYLADSEKVHAVKQGESVNSMYRVESATAGELELVYLPLSIKQTLLLGNKK